MRKVISFVTTLFLLIFGVTFSVPASASSENPVTVNITGLPAGCSFADGFKSGDTLTSPDSTYAVTVSCGTNGSATYIYNISVSDPSTTVINYAIPSVTFHTLTGHADNAFSECLGSATYHLQWNGNQYSDDSQTYTVDSFLDVLIQPDNVTGNYSFSAPIDTELYASESDTLGDAKAGECLMTNSNKAVTFAVATTTYDMTSNVSKLTASLDVPAGKTGKCAFTASNDTSLTKFGIAADLTRDSEEVNCEGITRVLPVQFAESASFSRGQETQGTVHVPDYQLVTVHGTVNEFYSSCNTGLSVTGYSLEGYQFDWSSVTVGNDGTFEVSLPKGTWYFTANGDGSQGISTDPCLATTTLFIGGSGASQNVTMDSIVAEIKLVLTQPANHDDCVIGDSTDPNHDLMGVIVGQLAAAVRVDCGNYYRYVQFDLPSNLAPQLTPTEVNVTVPALATRHVTGSFSFPSSISTQSDKESVSVLLYPIYDGTYGSSSGWYDNGNGYFATLNWSTKTYAADVPTGSYSLQIGSALPDSDLTKGCYATSYYAGANKPATWTPGLATGVNVSSGSGNLNLPALALKVGARIHVTWNYPADLPVTQLTFDLFNSEKQGVIRQEGQGGFGPTTSDAAYNFYCVAPGTYYVSAKTDAVATQYFGGTSKIDSAKAVTVRADGTADAVNFALYAVPTGSISGTVVGPDGTPLTNLSGYTVWASASNGEIGAAAVEPSGDFNIQGLQTNNIYRLVVSQDSEFGNTFGVLGGKNFAFYGNVHTGSESSLVPLTTNYPSAQGLQFVYTSAQTDAAVADVSPLAGITQPSSPVSSLTDLQSAIESGAVALSSAVEASSSVDGTVSLNTSVAFDGLRDAAVDMYLISTAPVTPGIATVRVGGATVSSATTWLGRVSIVNNQVKLPAVIQANPGISQIILVGRTSSTKVAYPLVVGSSKPTLVKNFVLSGAAKKGKTLTAGGGKWVGSPASISLSYKWFRCSSATRGCKAISGAKKATYKLVSSDVKKFIKVTISAKNSAGTSSTSLVTSAKAK